ncbi:ATP-grasp domain-containing protein [Pseudothauera rhizosphaerae]|uniref:Carbamoyl-phosphate synthase large subunit n=1 Tax=Pseudothauera rhizosphaerae TaxID=2565932 RepID=A0A4S4AVU6_9RHOO|nr:ATP-grasp domain-containing protein [Pseudothauera rhizosphaerae]THF64142.1 carbamoyl-phosphate synthase large subunit [Pseudothauera rhizosphaerae]
MTIPEKINVLIFPGEAENAFELFQALRYAPRFSVWGASSRPGYGNVLFPRYRDDLPGIHEAGFLPVFNRFLEENNIALIFPTHDDVALHLAELGDALKAQLVGSGVECARLCRAKRELYAAFAHEAFCPKTYGKPEDVGDWPVFIKPSQGQGGVGSARADDPETLQRLWRQTSDPVLCEYLPGEEYTVDCFSDRHGNLRFVGPRSRDVVRIGIAFVSRAVPVDMATQRMAEALNARLKPRGLWFFQTKKGVNGEPKLMEASCRAAGTMSVYRQLGINLPLLAAYDALDMDVRILKNDFQLTMRRRLHSSYIMDIRFDTVYVDYDDTLIVEGKVNALLMQFLYECRNRGKRLVVLSRHPGDLLANMRQYRVFPELFDEVIHLSRTDNKADFVKDRNAILIDNLFAEREEVLARNGIPVFDVDAVEGLL